MSNLDDVLTSTTTEEKQKILGELVSQGGVGVDDPMLVVPGLANHFRGIINGQAKMMELMPVVVDQRVTEKFDVFGKLLEQFGKLLEQFGKNKSASGKGGFDLLSLTAGVMGGLLVAIGLSWFVLIPREVARQRGADWAIGEYLTSPEGRAFRKSFNKCYQKGSCDSKH
jgi:hypothetical protein